MSYSAGSTGKGEIVVAGRAPGRAEINGYAAALRADPRFGTVSVPIGDLAGAQEGRFSITLAGTF